MHVSGVVQNKQNDDKDVQNYGSEMPVPALADSSVGRLIVVQPVEIY